MSAQWRFGIIGVGMWGRVHLENVRESGRGEVTWVFSRTAETVNAVKEEYGVPRATQDYREMLEAEDVDAVIIATPPHTHADICVDALHAGKHVLLEKPMAADLEDAERIVREAGRHPDLVVLEASARFTRLGAKYAFVRRMIEDGKLGRPYFVHHVQLKPTTYTEYNPKAGWAEDRSKAGGGPMFDWSGYDFSFHLGVLGDTHELKEVRTFSVNGLRPDIGPGGPDEVEQHAAALLEFDGGLQYYYERGGGAYGEVESNTRIHGTRGGIRFDYLPWGSNTIEWYSENDEGKVVRRKLSVDTAGHPDDPNTELVAHFVDCLEGEADPAVSVGLAYRHMQMVWRILRSP